MKRVNVVEEQQQIDKLEKIVGDGFFCLRGYISAGNIMKMDAKKQKEHYTFLHALRHATTTIANSAANEYTNDHKGAITTILADLIKKPVVTNVAIEHGEEVGIAVLIIKTGEQEHKLYMPIIFILGLLDRNTILSNEKPHIYRVTAQTMIYITNGRFFDYPSPEAAIMKLHTTQAGKELLDAMIFERKLGGREAQLMHAENKDPDEY